MLSYPVKPMKAVAGELPVPDEGWAYEVKWDGMRIVAWVADGSVRLQSTNLRDVTISYPELAALAEVFDGRRVVLDGEVIALDERGVPSFSALQHRMHIGDARTAAIRASEQPISYAVFDLLSYDGNDAVELGYLDRRRLLRQVIDDTGTWHVPAHHLGGGADLLAAVDRQGLEGILAKRVDSRYQPGARSSAWRKVKVRRHQEMVVGGWAPGEGRRARTLGGLLLGWFDADGALHFSGRVGTGFTDAELDRLGGVLEPLGIDECPFAERPPSRFTKDVRWVRPEVVVEIAYGEWTPDNRLRHPSYLGQRTDKDPREVGREP
ncbi:MAG: non-homologous end-joining DNA ligase [Actinomycetota bacterium]|nr:non-homologous end-joining DNA ligase [Actinomycetota bacterium]